MNKISLRDRMKEANSVEELNALLNEGRGYRFASNKTRNRIRRAAQARFKMLK